MNTVDTDLHQITEQPAGTNGPLLDRPAADRPPRSGRAGRRIVLLMAVTAGATYAYTVGFAKLKADVGRAIADFRTYASAITRTYASAITPAPPEVTRLDSTPLPPWDGFVRINIE